MKIFNRSLFLATLIGVSIACAPATYADPGKGRGHGQDKHDKHDSDDGDWQGKKKHDKKGEKHSHRFNDHDRVIIHSYLVERYSPNCPPGLAKKRNGCLPPGLAKKRYRVGYPLEHDVVYEIVPEPLLVQLEPVPMGYQYVMVDRDVLLISEASHKVIDAITLLSAVGK